MHSASRHQEWFPFGVPNKPQKGFSLRSTSTTRTPGACLAPLEGEHRQRQVVPPSNRKVGVATESTMFISRFSRRVQTGGAKSTFPNKSADPFAKAKLLSRLTPDAADPQCAFIVDVVLNVVLRIRGTRQTL